MEDENRSRRQFYVDYLILGNGIAGFNAAKEIRKRNQRGSILMVSQEEYETYRRPMLTKLLAAGVDPKKVAIADASWYEEHRVGRALGVTVDRIDPDGHVVHLTDDTLIGYKKLIYALGAHCFLPPIAGSDLPEVFTIRSIGDTKRLGTRLPQCKHAVVIGGGVLGLEAAWEIRKSGHEVRLIEIAPRLMPRQLDPPASRLLYQICEKKGVDIRTGKQVAKIEGDGHVSGITMSDGEQFAADLVVISSGVRANTALAASAGILVGRAVLADEYMRTNKKDIYAAGDCAEFQGSNFAIWPEASAQGAAAGAAAAGDYSEPYIPKVPAITFRGLDTSLFACGDNGCDTRAAYESDEQTNGSGDVFRKFYFRDRKVCGAILIGDVSQMMFVTKALEQQMDRTSFLAAFPKKG